MQFVWRYADAADREVVASIASGLAFGRLASVLASIERVLALLGPHPAAYLEALDALDDDGNPDHATRLRAATALAAEAFGKPQQAIRHETEPQVKIVYESAVNGFVHTGASGGGVSR